MENPEISVVMSVYNGAHYLRASLDSILAQKGVDFEVVVVNDGSTDGTGEMLSAFAAKDPRIRIFEQENAGLTRALIRGCREARGKYIARHDLDDLSDPERLALQRDLLAGDDSLSFVSSWAEVIGPENEPLLTYTRPGDADEATRQLLYDRIGPPGHGSVMFRRDAYEKVGGYRAQFYFAQDSDLWLRLGLVGRLNYVQKVLYRYRIASDSISGNLHGEKLLYASFIDELHAARMAGESEEPILERVPQQRPKPAAGGKPASSADATLYFIGKCLFDRRDPRALRYFLRAVQQNPWRAKAWALLPAAAFRAVLASPARPQ